MGWDPREAARTPFLILSTQGGLRGEDGRPIALGYHTGHWEVGLLVRAAAEAIREAKGLPFAASCTDPCDGRTQGTPGMMDSLPYRNDAAMVMRRQIRSLPRRAGVLGIATCDKGLPATMLALAGCADLPGVIVPGGVTLPSDDAEDAGAVQTLGARFAHGLVSLEDAAALACRACGTPGGGCQFLGTAATAQVVAEALGMALPHSALGAFGRADLARDGAPLGAGAAAARRARDSARASAHERGGRERHARPRGLRRLDQPRAAPARRRARRGPARSDRGRLAARQPRGAAARRRAAERPAQPPDRARLPRRRRARGDAAPAAHGPAQPLGGDRDRRDARPEPRLVGGEREAARPARAAAHGGRRSGRRRDGRRRRAPARAGRRHHRLPPRQPRAGRLARQGDGDRPVGGR